MLAWHATDKSDLKNPLVSLKFASFCKLHIGVQLFQSIACEKYQNISGVTFAINHGRCKDDTYVIAVAMLRKHFAKRQTECTST